MTIEEMLEIETIKQLRIRGSAYLDAGKLDELVELYHPDAVCEFGPYGSWTDRNEFASNFAEAEKPFYASGYFSNLHVVVNHVVELTGDDTATGLVYLLDFVTGDQMREGGNPLYWLGVYEESYARTDEGWKILRQSLNFIWPQRMLGDGFLDRQAG
ncbi:nuclear transport factor 2 family protein [Gordonia sp. OPL2]|uniref:nuclear transport factor 2 family protein n=1 Tax=Gordonia sp. OPL2 TaxID=2486274 RepID=UPI0016556F95|nr:nuclear transport factor 2 family protein [Gordonia sp. OPL2]ROZ99072.1 nuclear transport factor 2 family protein [Gordonia sp. OPL2]